MKESPLEIQTVSSILSKINFPKIAETQEQIFESIFNINDPLLAFQVVSFLAQYKQNGNGILQHIPEYQFKQKWVYNKASQAKLDDLANLKDLKSNYSMETFKKAEALFFILNQKSFLRAKAKLALISFLNRLPEAKRYTYRDLAKKINMSM